jgi:hypothetical protein
MGSETREYRFDDTDQLPVNPASLTQEIPTSGTPDEEPKKKKTGPTPKHSNRQGPPKDTQEAAAQTLRKFFNRGS